MRISDWSSDVCSSDLHAEHVVGHQHLAVALRRSTDADRRAVDLVRDFDRDRFEHAFDDDRKGASLRHRDRSEEHTSELQSLMRISYAVFCLKKKKKIKSINIRQFDFMYYKQYIENNNAALLQQ